MSIPRRYRYAAVVTAATVCLSLISIVIGFFIARSELVQVNRGERSVMGVEITNRTTTLIVESIRFDPHGGGPLIPSPGDTFIIPTLRLRNISTSTMQVIPILQFHVRDESGNVYPEIAAPLLIPEYSGALLPQDGLREEVAFEVPLSARGLTLYYESGQSGEKPIAVSLTGQN